MLNFLSPTEAGAFGVLLFFTTLYIVIFGIVTILMRLFCRMSGRKDKLSNKGYIYAALISFAPIMALLACSFGILNIWTLCLIIVFLFLIGFLVNKKNI